MAELPGDLSRRDTLRPTRDDRYMITKNWRDFAALSLQGTRIPFFL